jgi:hypothetical protein
MKTQLNQRLGTLESLMCTNNHDNINFNKVSHSALSRHKHHLVKREGVGEKLDNFEMTKLSKMSLYDFMNEVFHSNYSIEQLEHVWLAGNYHFDIPYVNKMIDNMICVIDLSKDMFTNNAHYLVIGIALLVNKMSGTNVIVCTDSVISFEGVNDVIGKKDMLLKYCGPCKAITVSAYMKMVNDNNKTLLFVTNKKINVDVQDKVVQLIPYYNNNYDVIMYEMGKHKKVTKYEDSKETVKERIKTIVEGSDDMKSIWHIYFIIIITFLWVALTLCKSFFIF